MARVLGWDMGIRTMNKGEQATFLIASELAYGATGYPPKIPVSWRASMPGCALPNASRAPRPPWLQPGAPLIFEVELLESRKADVVKTGTNFL